MNGDTYGLFHSRHCSQSFRGICALSGSFFIFTSIGVPLERFPFERNRSNDKKSLKIKMLEQALIEKVYQLFRSLL